MRCIDCSPIEPVEDEGDLKFRPCTAPFAAAVRDAGYAVEEAQDAGKITYGSREELLLLLEQLDRLQNELHLPLSLSLKGRTGKVLVERWFTLEQLKLRFTSENLIAIIANHNFCSHMQPIVDFNEAIMGFELLLRPLPGSASFKPYELFEMARQTGFHSFLDRAARISAIETSAKLLPKGIKRFVNFLPSSIYNPKYCLTHTFEAIRRLGQAPEDFVFEVVETEKISNIPHLQDIFSEYRNQGLLVALDDVGAGHSTIEVMTSLRPDYVKIDRGLISFCDQDETKQLAIRDIMNRAWDFGAKVLAEGIERREEFLFCRDIGMDLGQGYLLGKPSDKPPAHFGHIA
ncbi:EAL domain-containing protein [Paenibacillus sp. sgz5001063]|uniref:EAL domain-containing protein n=1 Tax=Paenibacillus sp. sgz5001063 TaxID=3242474 RepID=UPI0036D32E16